MATAKLQSPIGELTLVATAEGLSEIRFPGESPVASTGEEGPQWCRQAATQLAEYFAGDRQDFDLPLCPAGTPFQKRVWRELERTRFGQTTTYGAVAKRLGRPTASRAVGAANGRNPIPIVIPCHRIIGANGSLTGYAGGLNIKEWLLAHEGSLLLTR